MNRRTQRRDFPWRCSLCRAKEVYAATVSHTARVNHDGRIYELKIPALDVARCQAGGVLTITPTNRSARRCENTWVY